MAKKEKVKVKDYEFHELANIFPLMNDSELNDLAEDIKKNGLNQHIIIYEGKILDGRNRYLACRKAKVDAKYGNFENWYKSRDPLTFIMSENLYRRHLNSAQKAELALKILEVEEEKAKKRMISGKKLNPTTSEGVGLNQKSKGESIKITAKKVGISHNTLRMTKKIKEIIELEKNNKMGYDNWINNKWNECKKGKIAIKKVYEIAIKRPVIWNLREKWREGYRTTMEGEEIFWIWNNFEPLWMRVISMFKEINYNKQAYKKENGIIQRTDLYTQFIKELEKELEIIPLDSNKEVLSILLDEKTSIQMVKIF